MKSAHSLIINNDEFLVLADKALYWPKYKSLLIADAHFGKAAAYRALGQPVPKGTTTDNLGRLTALINQYPTQQLIFLGDFLHAPKSHAPATLAAIRAWRMQHIEVQCILIRGNHDMSAGDPPSDLHMDVVSEPYLIDGFALQHIPKLHATHHVIAGHVHPTYRLQGKGRQSLVLPCFFHEPSITLLPSFGDFTGGFVIKQKNNCKVLVTDSQCVWPI